MSRKSDLTSAAALLGRKGGKAAAKSMTPEERSVRARKAVQARMTKRQREREQNP